MKEEKASLFDRALFSKIMVYSTPINSTITR